MELAIGIDAISVASDATLDTVNDTLDSRPELADDTKSFFDSKLEEMLEALSVAEETSEEALDDTSGPALDTLFNTG